jgi:hypothetical protein
MLDAHPQIVVGSVLSQPMAQPSISEAHAMALATKTQASALLAELLAAKAASQSTSHAPSPASRRDLYAAVTGTSALDNAIDEARGMLARADRMLAAAAQPANPIAVPRPAVRATILAKGRDESLRVAM